MCTANKTHTIANNTATSWEQRSRDASSKVQCVAINVQVSSCRLVELCHWLH